MAESLPARARRVVNRLLQPLGLHLARRDRIFEMDGLLARAARRGTIATWIDVGASDGIWSLQARRHFPAAQFLLFEPLTERRAALRRLEEQHGFRHIAAAAGSVRGQVKFVIDAALDGSGVAAPGDTNTRAVPVETIDAAVAASGWSGPFGLKLDTHGHELAVLSGATGTLASTSLLIVEAYNFQLTPDCLRFHELCAWLEIRGFRCCDLADPLRRPGDGIFWQMDLAFARRDSAWFASNRYA